MLERHELRKVHVSFLRNLLFLPAYSPDLSPIEEAFSKFKTFVRRWRCRTIPALIKAIAQGLDKITAEDAKGWFVHVIQAINPAKSD